jgi:hypothetical protein
MSLTYLNDDKADDLAIDLFNSLTGDLPPVPSIDLTSEDYIFEEDNDSDLYSDVTPVTIKMLTEVNLEGQGVFDQMMAAIDIHINREFKENRITGDQYATVYGGTLAVVLGQAVNFTLQKDMARWQAIAAQMAARKAEIDAVTARVLLEKTKFEAANAQFQMENSKATVALTKMSIANVNGQHLLLMSQVEEQRYKVDNLLEITKDQQLYTLETLMPDQHEMLLEQIESERSKTLNTRTDGGIISGLVGKQRAMIQEQIDLIQEQIESERSKTLDTRTDGTVVVGQVGKQKDLVDEQIDSFIKDAKYKTAKLYFDGFITQYTILDSTPVPTEMTQAEINEVLVANRTYVGL